jgi:hypothetical protein
MFSPNLRGSGEIYVSPLKSYLQLDKGFPQKDFYDSIFLLMLNDDSELL